MSGKVTVSSAVIGGNSIVSSGLTATNSTFTLTPASGGQILCNQTPSSSTAIATKAYVDSAVAGGSGSSSVGNLADVYVKTPNTFNTVICTPPQRLKFNDTGVYLSIDFDTQRLLSSTPVNVTACAWNGSFYLAVSTNCTVYKSTNTAATTWTTLATNLGALGATSCASISGNSFKSLVYDTTSNIWILGFKASSGSRVATSADGLTWTSASGITGDVYSIASTPNFNTIMVSTSSSQIYKSTNHASSFTAVASGDTFYGGSTNGSGTWCFGSSAGIRTSTDDGTSWNLTLSNGGFDVSWTSRWNCFITISTTYVYTSADGVTWTQRGAHSLAIRCGAVMELSDGTILITDNWANFKFSTSRSPVNGTWTYHSPPLAYMMLNATGYYYSNADIGTLVPTSIRSTTKRTVNNTNMTITGNSKVLTILCGKTGIYAVSWYLRILCTSDGIARIWCTVKNSADVDTRVGTIFDTLDGTGQDFMILPINTTTGTFIHTHTTHVTTPIDDTYISVYCGVSSGGFDVINHNYDSNFGSHLSIVGPL